MQRRLASLAALGALLIAPAPLVSQVIDTRTPVALPLVLDFRVVFDIEGQMLGQTFTAPAGARLESVRFFGTFITPVTVALWDTFGPASNLPAPAHRPVGPPLLEQVVAPTGNPFVDLLGGGLPLVSGHRYFVSLLADVTEFIGPNFVHAAATAGPAGPSMLDVYAGGELWTSEGAPFGPDGDITGWYPPAVPGADLQFVATFSAVPEPATAALVGGGLALLALAARRRRTT